MFVLKWIIAHVIYRICLIQACISCVMYFILNMISLVILCFFIIHWIPSYYFISLPLWTSLSFCSELNIFLGIYSYLSQICFDVYIIYIYWYVWPIESITFCLKIFLLRSTLLGRIFVSMVLMSIFCHRFLTLRVWLFGSFVCSCFLIMSP